MDVEYCSLAKPVSSSQRLPIPAIAAVGASRAEANSMQ